MNYIDKGRPNYVGLMQIPSSHRINAYAEKNISACLKSISAIVKISLRSYEIDMNFCIDISTLFVQESKTYNLALEDILIFFQRLNAGEYGDFYGKKLTPVMIMTKFSIYCEDRDDAIVSFREQEYNQAEAQDFLSREVNPDSELSNVLSRVGAAFTQIKNNLKNE